MSVKIIIDSTTDLMPAVKARCLVVPLTVHFGDEEYIDATQNLLFTNAFRWIVSSDRDGDPFLR